MKRIRALCKCGCGEFVANLGNTYIYGHQAKGKNNYMYGKKHTEAVCEAQSKRMKGRMVGKKHPMYGKRGKASPIFGNKRPDISGDASPFKRPEVKAKISAAGRLRVGKLNPMYGKGGNLHWNWQGGKKCEPYCVDWTKEYKEYIKERDNHECQNPDCHHNCDNLPLTVHHIDYIKKNCHPKNLLTLCNSCNVRANFGREFWMELYQGIIEKKYNQRRAA